MDNVEKALNKLSGVLQQRPEFEQYISSPWLTREDKKILVSSLTQMTGNEPLLKNFYNVLLDNHRLYLLTRIQKQFSTLMRAKRGEIEVKITSATPLDSKILSRLESRIAKSKYGKGKLLVSNKVTPSIIGGLIVEIGDNILDVSVGSRLNNLNKLLSGRFFYYFLIFFHDSILIFFTC